jgi:hypothetical protein
MHVYTDLQLDNIFSILLSSSVCQLILEDIERK